ncbi:putative bifunctional diguanylate cyclase/phosphodiesterase [Phaeovulum vinaykumarii]|uniref:putative bifunctional diguanylate cyclase/phosphodiesterase n=1 Tax=Phaeovulum vinaykumarii TaxID=407234 RepID=UPI0013566666|nr:bifunctional diguanylate cyclase/phosphodiesterase [Phaeovulum vinaykumarii]
MSLGRLSDRITLKLAARSGSGSAQIESRLPYIRNAQIRSVMGLSRVMMAANMVNVGAFVLAHDMGRMLTPVETGWCLAVLGFAGIGLLRARHFAGREGRRRSRARATGKLVVSSAVLALLWCFPMFVTPEHATPLMITFISTLEAGMIAGGAIALYPVPLAALVHVGILAAAAVPAAIASMGFEAVPFLILIPMFVVVVLRSISRHAGLFLTELLGRMEAETQRDTIQLLIGDYQSTGAHCLWQTDADLRFVTPPEGVSKLLGRAGHDAPETLPKRLSLPDLLATAGCHGYRSEDRATLDTLARAQPGEVDHFRAAIECSIDPAAPGGRRILEIAGRRSALPDRATVVFNGFLRDMTEEFLAKERALLLATRDPLTGLVNHAVFSEIAARTIPMECSLGRHVALFFLDADNLKMVNDNFGHAAGDLLIRTIAERLNAAISPGALISRKGGDEFLILDFVDTAEQGRAMAADLMAALNRPFEHDGRQIALSCSMGAALCCDPECALDTLEREADRALYFGKSRGKRVLQIYDATVGEAVRIDRILTHDIGRALKSRDFNVHFQPILNVPDRRIQGAEALLRWTHPDFGAMDPMTVVAIATREGHCGALSEFMLEAACREALSWPPDLFVSVNIPPSDLDRPDFAERVRGLLEGLGFDPRRLWIEITEERLASATDTVERNLEGLRALGVRIAVDDFGAGYSSLGALDRYSCDIIKLDRSIVRDCDRRPNSRVLIRTVRDLAWINGFAVVAEGVETEAELEGVIEGGFDYVQGFLFHRPVSAAEFRSLIGDAPPPQTRRRA